MIAANKAATAARVAAVKAVQNRMDGKFCETFVWQKSMLAVVCNCKFFTTNFELLGRCHPDELKLIGGWKKEYALMFFFFFYHTVTCI